MPDTRLAAPPLRQHLAVAPSVTPQTVHGARPTMPQQSGLSIEAIARLRLVIFRLSRRIVRQWSDPKLTPSMMSALSTVERSGNIRLSELGSRERIGKSSVTRLVARLENLDLISRVDDPTDARSSLVSTTAEGRALLDASSQRVEAYLAQQIAALSPEDRELLLQSIPVLERLLAVRA